MTRQSGGRFSPAAQLICRFDKYDACNDVLISFLNIVRGGPLHACLSLVYCLRAFSDPNACGGSLSLAVRGGGFSGAKAVTQLNYRSITKISPRDTRWGRTSSLVGECRLGELLWPLSPLLRRFFESCGAWRWFLRGKSSYTAQLSMKIGS